MKLLITRHGQAQDNVSGITMGQRDSRLTALGVQQAKSKALQLEKSSQKIDYIYTSDLGRCTQTARVISSALGLPEAIPDKNLREISFGKYEGLPYSAVPHREDGYMEVRFPGGESNEEMVVRVIDAINRIYESNKEACVLVISHSGPIAAILASFYGKELQTTLDSKVGNEEIITLQVDSALAYPIPRKE